MRRLWKIVGSPWLYAAWMLVVLAVLPLSYFADPYIFAFTVLTVAGISAGLGLIGLSVALLFRVGSWRSRASIVLCVVVAVVAVIGAFGILKTFNWA